MTKKVITSLAISLLNIMSFFVIYQRDDVYSTVLIATVTFICVYWGKPWSILVATLSTFSIYFMDYQYALVLLASLIIYILIFDYFIKVAYSKNENKSLVQTAFMGIALAVAASTFFTAIVYQWSVHSIVLALILDSIAGMIGVVATSFASYYYKDWFVSK
ncbi:hypothetical protein PRVXT_002821 [Proteinivorax tanatarense]|uniref:Uncharacterized protein n=1 Tax=Proteinivorax tanatarense TaxID=1260629 RepID=A0AAU7VL40_9FIRM